MEIILNKKNGIILHTEKKYCTEDITITVGFKRFSGEFVDLDSNLPIEYIELDYIESTGTQYIDLEYTPNTNTKVELNAGGITEKTFPVTSGGWFIGGRTAYEQEAFGTYYNPGQQALYAAFGNQQISAEVLSTDFYNKDHTFVIDRNGLFLDNKKLFSFNNTFTGQYPLYLFTINLAGFTANLLSYKFYSCTIWEDGNIVREYIPCKRRNDAVIGVYDTITQQFFTNKGTGEFLGG